MNRRPDRNPEDPGPAALPDEFRQRIRAAAVDVDVVIRSDPVEIAVLAEPTVEELDHVVDSLVAVVDGGSGGVGFVAGGGGGGVRARVEKRGGCGRGGGGEVGIVGSGEEGEYVVV